MAFECQEIKLLLTYFIGIARIFTAGTHSIASSTDDLFSLRQSNYHWFY